MNKIYARQIAEALTSLIDGWNDAGEREDRGRPNDALCLVLYDDGSGRLGTFRPIHFCKAEGITTLNYDEVMNTQCEFDNCEQLAAYLADWCEDPWERMGLCSSAYIEALFRLACEAKATALNKHNERAQGLAMTRAIAEHVAERCKQDTVRLNLLESRLVLVPVDVIYADGSKPPGEEIHWELREPLVGEVGMTFREVLDRTLAEQEG